MAVVKFTQTPLKNERIFDFGKGPENDNLILASYGAEQVYATMMNAGETCFIKSDDVLKTNIWTTIVMKYTSSSKIMELRIGSAVVSTTCASARTDWVVSNTFVGKSNWDSNPYLTGRIAGLYTVDAALSEPEISKITNKIYRGEDSMQPCQMCHSNALSQQSSSSAKDCVLHCPAGQFLSAMASNVALMCGAAHNSACPSVLSSTHGELIASNGNAGNVRTKVHTQSGSTGANTYRIDLEQTRNIHYVKNFNRFDCCWDKLVGAHIRIGSSPLWADNPACQDAEFNADSIQDRTCNLSG